MGIGVFRETHSDFCVQPRARRQGRKGNQQGTGLCRRYHMAAVCVRVGRQFQTPDILRGVSQLRTVPTVELLLNNECQTGGIHEPELVVRMRTANGNQAARIGK